MPDPRIFAKFARDIAGWYGDVGRTAEAKILAEAQKTGMEAGRFGSPDIGGGQGFLSGRLTGRPTSVDYNRLYRAGSPQYEPGVRDWDKKSSGFNTFREDVNDGKLSGFDMHSHPPLVVSPHTGSASGPRTTRDAQSEMYKGVAGPLAPSEGDFSVWLRHYNDSLGNFAPRPTLNQTAYIQGSQPRSLLAMGSPDFNEGLLPGIDKVAPGDLYKIMADQNNKRTDLWKELANSRSATDVTKDYGATLPELWAAIHTNRMAQRGVPMTFEDRAPFGKGWLQDAMTDFYKTSDKRGEGFEHGGPVEMETGGGVLRKLIRAYHGSPYAFDKFDPTKIGSGEGAQAYGYGHYFTDKEDIARGYRDRLAKGNLLVDDAPVSFSPFGPQADTSVTDRFYRKLHDDARQNFHDNNSAIHPDDLDEALTGAYARARAYANKDPVAHDTLGNLVESLRGKRVEYRPGGHMYDVNLGVNPQDLLNWDAPLTDVSSKIRDPLLSVLDKASSIHPNAEGMFRSLYNNKSDLGRYTGRDVYSSLSGPWTPRAKGKEEASSLLFGEGIPGIRYLDGMSRNAGEGTSNYVMFPGTEKDIVINRRYEQGGPVDTPTEGEGGLYGAPDSMFNTPESLAAALYPQHGTAYGDGGPVHMEYGGILRRASRLGDMMDEITRRHGASQGRRFEQASDSANLDRYSDDALRQTFGRSDTGLYTTMPPGRFEDFAAPIPDRFIHERPYFKWQYHPDADMLSPNQQSYDEYMRTLKTAAEYGGGLDQVPYLKLNKGLPFNDVASHEGRHRMRMFDEERDKNSLVQLLPTGGYGLFDDRVERLMKLYFPHGNEMPYMPEKSNVYDAFRPMVQFPNPVFAEGGEVEMAGGGADKIKDAVGFLRRLSKYNDAPSKHIDDYQWKPMSEVGERLGQIDAIPPHVENFGAFMQEQAQRAANEGLSPRDLLKAFGISRGSIQRSALPTDSIRATGLEIPGSDPTIRPEGAFATWMGTKPGQSWLDKGQSGIVDFDAINDAQQRLAPFGKSGDLAQFLQWGPENLPGREGRLSELVDRARKTGNSAPEEWKDAVGDLFGIGLAKRGFFSAMLGRGDQPVFDARQIDLHVPKGHYAEKYGKRAGTEGGDEIMARLAARQEALGIGVPKDLMPFQQYLTHHTTWDKMGNEATTHQDLIDSLRGHAEGGPIEMSTGGQYDARESEGDGFFRRNDIGDMYAGPVQTVKRLIMPHARSESRVVPNRDIESRYWDHKKPPNLDTIFGEYADHPPVDVPTMKIEDIAGGRLIAVPHDRSATDVTLHGYNGNTFADPVTSPGGPKFAFGRNPEAVTASGESVIKKLHEAAVQSAEEGRTPYLAPWLMGPHGVDFSTHMNEAVAQSLPFLKVPMAKRDEVNKLLAGVFTDFPGIEDKDLVSYLHNMVGTTRRDLPKLLDKAEMVNAGLDVGGLRAALTDPGLLHAPYGSSGAAISRIDPSKSPTMFGYPQHPSYPWQLQGTPVGGLDPMVPPQILYPDFFRSLPPETQLGPKGKPVNNRRAFEMSSMKGGVGQDVNDEVINKVNEYQEYMRNIRGRKEGGTVEDQYHPIWQQGFAGGGQPDTLPVQWDQNYDYENDPRDRSTVSGNLADALYGGRITPTPEERRAFREERAARRAEHPEGVYSTDPVRGLLGMLQKQRAGWQADQAEMYPDESSPWQRAGDQLSHMGRTLAHDVTGGLSDKLIAALSPGDYSANVPREEAATRSSRDQLDPYVRAPMSVLPYALSPAQQIKQYAMMVGSNLAEPAHGAIDWARKQFDKSMLGMVRPTAEGVSGALSPAFTRPMWDKSYGYSGGGSVEDQYHPIWSQNFKDGGGVHDILGTLGGLAGNLIPIPVLGPMLGKFAGHTLGNLIEGNSDEIGDDAARDFTFGMADPDTQGWAFGGPIGPTLPKDDFTSGGEEPGMPSFGPGIPGFDVDPLRTNPQVARDAAERNSMLRQVQADSQKGLAEQMKAKDGGGGGGVGGMGGMLSSLAPFASMIPGVGPMVGMGMSMAGKMMAADGGPVGHYADGGSIPAPNGEQPWMYGGGALMARGGYLRSRGGMNG